MPLRRTPSARDSIVLALLLAGAACTAKTPAASTSTVLAPEQTWVIVSKPAQPAALDVVRMFHDRGFALVDMQRDDRGLQLRFKGARKQVSEQITTPLDVLFVAAEVADALENTEESARRSRDRRDHYEPTIEHYDLGSVFYVRIEPRGDAMTSISAIGRPTRDGVDACTNDPIAGPCTPLAAGDAVYRDIDGYAEAELIGGVFAELRLEGSVVAPDVQAVAANRRCWEIRREREQAAARVTDSRAKAGIMRTAPVCGIATPSLASK